MTSKLLKSFLLKALHFYSHYISYYFAPSCRFYPSCSHYASEAIEEHGCVRGSWLSLIRLSRCHPWHEGGHDPVPEKACFSADSARSANIPKEPV